MIAEAAVCLLQDAASTPGGIWTPAPALGQALICLLYTSDAADERSSVDLGGRRIIKKKKRNTSVVRPHVQEYTRDNERIEMYRQNDTEKT